MVGFTPGLVQSGINIRPAQDPKNSIGVGERKLHKEERGGGLLDLKLRNLNKPFTKLLWHFKDRQIFPLPVGSVFKFLFEVQTSTHPLRPTCQTWRLVGIKHRQIYHNLSPGSGGEAVISIFWHLLKMETQNKPRKWLVREGKVFKLGRKGRK